MIAVLCGGVGAARFLSGLVAVVPPESVTAIVNTGDDLELFGLEVSPDLDTVTYTLAGAVNPATGWGLAEESFTAMDSLERFGADTWFRLGDRDLATHLYRTQRLRAGATLSQVSAEIATAFGIGVRLLPMSDDPVRTRLTLETGEEVDFQHYFVKLRHEVAVRAVRFVGAETARPTAAVRAALEEAEVVVIAPSNPLVSIGPILSLPGLRELLAARRSSVVAVSPIIAGAALKGPAARLLTELGGLASALGVAEHFAEIAATLVVDGADRDLAEAIRATGVECVVAATVMTSPAIAAELARVTVASGAAR